MSLTHRGRWLAAATVSALAAAGVIGFFVVSGATPTAIKTALSKVGVNTEPAPPPPCPLTGQPAPDGNVPERPALAIKVENLPESRPQAGLDQADIVYEEPVEGGITRFIVVYQCHESNRVGPVRSGRVTDPGVLVQYGKPVFGFAGGVHRVVKEVDKAGLIDVNYLVAPKAYHRDPSRPAPHNLYTSTKQLWAAGRSKAGAPEPVFHYAQDIAGHSKKVRTVHLPFSQYSDVYWKWSGGKDAWLRSHGTVKHTLESGDQVQATNVVVQEVKVVNTQIHDANGVVSPEAITTGTGKAYVFRNGRMITGKWVRPKQKGLTRFQTRGGDLIKLSPGNTWVELLPNTIKPQTD